MRFEPRGTVVVTAPFSSPSSPSSNPARPGALATLDVWLAAQASARTAPVVPAPITRAASLVEAIAIDAAQYVLVEEGPPFAATDELRRARRGAGILVLTTGDDEGLVLAALEAGADDVLGAERSATAGAIENALARSAARARRRRAEAQRGRTARERWIRVFAHDLRNPLNVVAVAVSSIARGAGDRTSLYLDKVRRAAERANDVVEDLLDVTRLDSGSVTLEPELHAIQDLVDEALELAGPMARDRRVAIGAEVLPGAEEARVDRERAVKILVHLLRRAVNLSSPAAVAPEGSFARVTVSLRPHENGLEITTTAPGAAEMERRLLAFEPYGAAEVDLDPPRTIKSAVGPVIVRGLVRAHGGEVEVNDVGGGALEYRLSLPRVPG